MVGRLEAVTDIALSQDTLRATVAGFSDIGFGDDAGAVGDEYSLDSITSLGFVQNIQLSYKCLKCSMF